jgi:cytochrome c553
MITKRLSIALCLFVTACGGGDDGEPATTPEPTAYKDMSFDQRAAFMTKVVLPEMQETFVAFDAKFESMSCATCHGAGATDGTYAMPSPEIAPLPPEEEFAEYMMDPEHAKWGQFMLDEVWPQMAKLLQVPVYDPATHTDGFSCANCHTVKSVAP